MDNNRFHEFFFSKCFSLFSYTQEYFDHHLMEDGTIAIRNTDQEEHEPIHLPEGISINVVIAIPFLDVNPIASTE